MFFAFLVNLAIWYIVDHKNWYIIPFFEFHLLRLQLKSIFHFLWLISILLYIIKFLKHHFSSIIHFHGFHHLKISQRIWIHFWRNKFHGHFVYRLKICLSNKLFLYLKSFFHYHVYYYHSIPQWTYYLFFYNNKCLKCLLLCVSYLLSTLLHKHHHRDVHIYHIHVSNYLKNFLHI